MGLVNTLLLFWHQDMDFANDKSPWDLAEYALDEIWVKI